MKNKEPKWTVYFLHGKYAVFNDGEIWTFNWHNTNKARKIKPVTTRQGYNQVRIKGKIVYVHRLVAELFVRNKNINKYKEVNHINEVKTDNRAENLEWCDHKYNLNYGTYNERMSISLTNHPKFSKPVYQYTKDGKFVAEYPSTGEVERKLGYHRCCIANCCRGNRKTAYGYIWTYNPPANI